jgi:hypothetical protein
MCMSSARKAKPCSCRIVRGGRRICVKATGSTDPRYARWRPASWPIFPPFAPNGGRSVEISDTDIQQAEQRMAQRLESDPHAVAARYDRRVSRVMVTLSNGLELAFPPHMAEGLADAKLADLAVIEITPTGVGLRWPRLDADLYLPALLEGVFGSPLDGRFARSQRWFGAFGGEGCRCSGEWPKGWQTPEAGCRLGSRDNRPFGRAADLGLDIRDSVRRGSGIWYGNFSRCLPPDGARKNSARDVRDPDESGPTYYVVKRHRVGAARRRAAGAAR